MLEICVALDFHTGTRSPSLNTQTGSQGRGDELIFRKFLIKKKLIEADLNKSALPRKMATGTFTHNF